MMRRCCTAALAAAALAVGAPAASGAPATLQTGVTGGSAFADGGLWATRTARLGASRVRLSFGWSAVNPTAPPSGEAGHAGWSGYRFDRVDAQVRNATAAGLTVMLMFNGTPAWASAPGRTGSYAASAWKPDPVAFGTFMRAVAERYSGTFPDPASPGATLPRVQQFQLWNEPNLAIYLAPQRENGQAFAAVRFRELVNAGYAGIKSVQPDATVVAAGLAPYGDPGKNPRRTRPVVFLRDWLCLDADLRRACDAATAVDVVAMHPYTRNPPGQAAYDADDIALADMGKVNRLVDAATRVGTLRPGRPAVWITEIGYETVPQDPQKVGVPVATRARYISESLWRAWRAGVRVVDWYALRDDPPRDGALTYQSGLYTAAGQAKGDVRAFRFPLLVTSASRTKLRVWFRTPASGTVAIQTHRGGGWRTVVRKRRLVRDQVVRVLVPRTALTTGVRGRVGRTTSYAWKIPKLAR